MNFRIIKAALKLLIYFPFYIFSLKKSIFKNDEEKWKLISKIARKITKASNITINCTGKENLGKNFMIFSNHLGLYDPIAIASVLDNNTAFVLKDELKKFKTIDLLVKLTDSEYLDRNDPKKQIKTMNAIYKKLQNEKNFVIFPEGTRNKTPEKLLPFKPGAFKAALKAKVDIVPTVLFNTEYAIDKNKKGKLEIKIIFLKPLKYEDYKNLTTTEISKIVQGNIQKEIDK